MKGIVLQRGLNCFQLKLLGIIFMTLDHVGEYYGPNIGTHPFRIAGRIAAPLFLYIVVNSAHHTRNKLIYMFRLYIAHVLICLTTLFLTSVWNVIFNIDQFSILSTFTYVVMFIWIIEKIINLSSKDRRRVILYILLIFGIIFIPVFFMFYFNQFEIIYIDFLPTILTVPYSPLFIIMGICWYFFEDQKKQIFILILFSFFSLFGSKLVDCSSVWIFMDFFNSNQFFMILFIPFIYFYNGQKGRSMKYFFYIYYPLHIFILLLIRYLCGLYVNR